MPGTVIVFRSPGTGSRSGFNRQEPGIAPSGGNDLPCLGRSKETSRRPPGHARIRHRLPAAGTSSRKCRSGTGSRNFAQMPPGADSVNSGVPSPGWIAPQAKSNVAATPSLAIPKHQARPPVQTASTGSVAQAARHWDRPENALSAGRSCSARPGGIHRRNRPPPPPSTAPSSKPPLSCPGPKLPPFPARRTNP